MYTPLNCITTYSLQYSPNRIDKLCKSLATIGCKYAAIADLGTIAGVVEFISECEANKIKPIIGCRFFICEFDSSNHNKYNDATPSIMLCKNLDGWKKLVRLISAANVPTAWNVVPRLSLDEVREIVRGKDIIAISGGPHSNLSTCIVNEQQFYTSSTLDEAKQYVHKDWVERCEGKIGQYQETFGKDNFYLEICNTDWCASSSLLTKGLRWLSQKLNVPCVATTQPYYLKPEDAEDQRLLLCSKLGATFNSLEIDQDDQFTNRFFHVDTFTLKTHDELALLNSPEEIANTNKIASLIEDYTIFSPPKTPTFDCPDGLSESEYLRKLCREGWTSKIADKIPDDSIPKYVDRVKEELGVFEENSLAGYFLVMHDLIKAAHVRGELTGLGRGSAAGCLVSYLLNITGVDPIKYDLLFSRFFNASRKGSLPDIDVDFEVLNRVKTIEYITQKYGAERVGKVVTYGRMMGRGAIKEVLRIHNACSFSEMNNISDAFPEESKISDELQILKDSGLDASIIEWTLKHRKKELEEYCYIDEKGTYQGRFAKYFEQARRLEGCLKSLGSHASAVILADEPLSNICPMIRSATGNDIIAGIEYEFLEKLGVVKLDILGTAVLDKIHRVADILKQPRKEYIH